MIPRSFEYHAPRSIADALGLLAQFGDDAKLLARAAQIPIDQHHPLSSLGKCRRQVRGDHRFPLVRAGAGGHQLR